MAGYTIKEITKEKEWESNVLSFEPHSFLQSWNWGEVQIKNGNNIWRLGIFNKTKCVGVCLVIKQAAMRGTHFIVPGGPLIPWSNKTIVKTLLSYLTELAVKENALFIRIRTELLDSEENKDKLVKHGFLRAPMHLHAENTWVLPLDQTEDELLKGMRKNTRALVKKSMSSELTITKSSNPHDAEILYSLQKETVARHKFVGFSKKLFEMQLDIFGRSKQALLYVVRYQNEPIAASIIIFYGNYAYYHHSASSYKALKIPASYFLQWNIIKDAKKKKLKGYNFWGIAPEGNRKHRFSGVTTFKTGFGGNRIDWLPAYDLPISKRYYITYIFELLRKKIRHL